MKKTLHTLLTSAAFAAAMQQKAATADILKSAVSQPSGEKSVNKENSADTAENDNTKS